MPRHDQVLTLVALHVVIYVNDASISLPQFSLSQKLVAGAQAFIAFSDIGVTQTGVATGPGGRGGVVGEAVTTALA